MNGNLSQRKAKILISDYLRETGRKGVTNVIKDIYDHSSRHFNYSKRAFELWLKNQDRQMQREHWIYVEAFIESEKFLQKVSYSTNKEATLVKVADGLRSLYENTTFKEYLSSLDITDIKRSSLAQQSIHQIKGYWHYKKFALQDGNSEQAMKISPIPFKPYGIFAREITESFAGPIFFSTGFIFYLGEGWDISGKNRAYFYILHSWHKKVAKYSEISGLKTKLYDVAPIPEKDEILCFVENETSPYFHKNKLSQLQRESYFSHIPENSMSEAKFLSTKKNLDILIKDVLPHG